MSVKQNEREIVTNEEREGERIGVSYDFQNER